MKKPSSKNKPITSCNLIDEVDSKIYLEIHRMRSDFPLSYRERQVILNICRQILENKFDSSNMSLLDLKVPAIILVSLYKKAIMLGCSFEPANTFADSLILSTTKTIEIAKLKHSFTHNEVHFRINILFYKKIIDNTNINSIQRHFLLGIHSISMDTQDQFAILKNCVSVNYGYSYETTLYTLAKKCNADYSAVFSKKTTLARYNTIEFREDYFNLADSYGLVDLYRGKQIILQKEITMNHLENSLWQAYSALRNFLFLNDEIAYEYSIHNMKWIFRNDHPAKLRKMASLWVFIEVAQFLNDKMASTMAKKLLSKILNQNYQTENEIGFLDLDGVVDIGASGFLLLALNATNCYYKEILQISRFIYSSYDKKNKKFVPIIKPSTINSDIANESEYYLPGIGIKALSESKNIPLNFSIDDLSLQTLPYYQNLFRQSKEGIKMVTWLTSAYANVFLRDNRKSVLAYFVYEMNDTVLKGQVTNLSSEIDLIGSFSKTGNTLVTAAVTESLINAYKVAESNHDDDRTKIYKKAILMALRSILQSQITSDETDDVYSIGGFKTNFFDNHIRIDAIQHCAYVLLNFIKLYL